MTSNNNNHGSRTLRLRPSEIRFSQDSIKTNFKNGQSVHRLYEELRSGQKPVSSVQQIRVVENENMQLVSLDNRRLYVFRALEYEGELSHIYVKLVKKSYYSDNRFSTINKGTSVKIRGGGTRLPHSIEEIQRATRKRTRDLKNIPRSQVETPAIPYQGAIRRRARDLENLPTSQGETLALPKKSYARRDITANHVIKNATVKSRKEIEKPSVSWWQTTEDLFEDHRSVQYQRCPPRPMQRETEYLTPVKNDESPDCYDSTRGYEGWGSLAIFTATSVLGGILLWRYHKSGNESKFEFAGTSVTDGIPTENSGFVTVVKSMPSMHDKAVNTASESAVDVFEEGPSVIGTMWNGAKFTFGWGIRGLLYAMFGSFRLFTYIYHQLISRFRHISAVPSAVTRGQAEVSGLFNQAVDTVSQIAADVSEQGPSDALGLVWNGAKSVFGWGIRVLFRLLTYICHFIPRAVPVIPSAISRGGAEMANWFNPAAFSGLRNLPVRNFMDQILRYFS